MLIGKIIVRTLLNGPVLLLWVIPLGFFGSVFWMIGFAIVVLAFRNLFREVRTDRRPVLLATCLITIALYFGACANCTRAWSGQAKQAKAIALEVHGQCAKDGACPPVDKVCTPGESMCRSGGTLAMQLPIRYERGEDGRSFSVRYSTGPDDSTTFRGGVGVPLTRERYMDTPDSSPPEVLIAAPDAGPLGLGPIGGDGRATREVDVDVARAIAEARNGVAPGVDADAREANVDVRGALEVARAGVPLIVDAGAPETIIDVRRAIEEARTGVAPSAHVDADADADAGAR